MAELIKATDNLNEGRKKLNAIAKEMNEKDIASMPEIIVARGGESDLSSRLQRDFNKKLDDSNGSVQWQNVSQDVRDRISGATPTAGLGPDDVLEMNIANEAIPMHKTDFVNISRYKNVYDGVEISGAMSVATGASKSDDRHMRTNYINTGIYEGGLAYIINAYGAKNFVFSYKNKNDQEGTLLENMVVNAGLIFSVELPPGEPYIRFITVSPSWTRTGEIEVWSGGRDSIGGVKLNETFEFRKNANIAEFVNYNLGWNVGKVGEPFTYAKQKTTEHIPVEPGDIIEIKIKEKDPHEHATYADRVFRYAFYTEPIYDGEFLVCRGTAENEEATLTVPEGAKFFAISNYFRDLLDIKIKKGSQGNIPEEPNPKTAEYFNNLIQVFPKYTTIGDSLTAGFTRVNGKTTGSVAAVQTKNNWPGFLELRTGREFNNIAVGGSTVKDWRDMHLVTAEAETDAYTVALGVNDARQGLAVGTSDDIETDRNLNADTFYGNYDYLVRELKEYNSNAHVFLFTIPPHESNAETYNPVIRHIANLYEKVHLIDLHNLYYDEYTSGFLADGWVGAHYTPITYNYHSSLIEEALNTYIYNNGGKFIAVPYE